MQIALSQENFIEQVYEKYGYEERIVGIVFARYTDDSVSEIIDNNFDYWDNISGNDVDLFWAGYGKYYYDNETKTRLTIKVADNVNKVYYDESAVQSFKKAYPGLKRLKKDRVSIVFLGYDKGRLLVDNAICFQFPLVIDKDTYKEIMNNLILLCKEHKKFNDFKYALNKYKIECKVQNITVSDIIAIAGTVIGTAVSFL